MNVLVVDDSDIIRRMIVKTLSLADLQLGRTLEAANGREALEILEDEWVDVVIADLNMPVMGGMDLLHSMRDTTELRSTPVIVVSTEGASTRLAALKELGVATFVRKPFTPEQIRDAVTSLTVVADGAERSALVADLGATVLERFAMLFAEPVDVASDGPVPAPPGQLLASVLRFSGVITGAVTAAAPLDLCAAVARNALGVEDAVDESAGADALGEFTNMLAGMLGTTVDADLHTELTPPVVTRFTASEWAQLAAQPFVSALDVEGLPMLLALHMRREQ